MANQTVFNLSDTFGPFGGPPIHPDDPPELKVAKRLMRQEHPVYVQQPDGTFKRVKLADDYYETDSNTVTFSEPVSEDDTVFVQVVKDGE